MIAMSDKLHNLAIETSDRRGSITIGRADQPLETLWLEHSRRHNVDLLPKVDEALKRHGGGPRSLGEVYVSVGPGSFTGLRVAVATAQILGLTLGAKLVAVPTLEALAGRIDPGELGRGETLAVVLNHKADTAWCGLYRLQPEPKPLIEPGLRGSQELLDLVDGPLAVFGPSLPPGLAEAIQARPGVRRLEEPADSPQALAVWKLGRRAARAGRSVEPDALAPIYARQPEAVRLWEARKTDVEQGGVVDASGA
jgi:tRNA threonylcarbamoyladenosine biosynthesis protein TsaB